MTIPDTYYTITKPVEAVFRDKGSRFIALAFPIEDETSAKAKITELKKQYHDARHHCYAYVLGYDKATYRLNDDGEPSGTAGRPIYGQILAKRITNLLVVVIRYFGGVKLGTSGLINAYKTATKEALDQAVIIQKKIEKTFTVSFDYIYTNKVMQLLKVNGINIQQQSYQEQCKVTFTVISSKAEELCASLAKIPTIINC
jgi:uncharacterized YigZ family protein